MISKNFTFCQIFEKCYDTSHIRTPTDLAIDGDNNTYSSTVIDDYAGENWWSVNIKIMFVKQVKVDPLFVD